MRIIVYLLLIGKPEENIRVYSNCYFKSAGTGAGLFAYYGWPAPGPENKKQSVINKFTLPSKWEFIPIPNEFKDVIDIYPCVVFSG